MKKGEIYKISGELRGKDENKSVKFSCYGICISGKKNSFFTEDGCFLIPEHNRCYLFERMRAYLNNPYRKFCIFDYSLHNFETAPAGDIPKYIQTSLNRILKDYPSAFVARDNYKRLEQKAKATLNSYVSKNQIASLEAVAEYKKLEDEYNQLKEDEMNKIETYTENISSELEKIRSKKGLLSHQEFYDEFKNNLSPEIQNEIQEWRGLSYKDRIVLYRDIEIQRNVEAQNYDFIDLKWRDKNSCSDIRANINPDKAKCSRVYKQILNKHYLELPFKTEDSSKCSLSKELDIDSFNTLRCIEKYTISISDKPLTKEYAKELANEICDIKSKGDNEQDDINNVEELLDL